MKFSEKGQTSLNGANQLFGVDFHDFTQKEQGASMMKLAAEFGLNVKDVKNLKRQLGRS